MIQNDFKLGNKIKTIRLSKGIKANKVANDLNVHPSTYCKYESDARKIPSTLLPQLAISLKVKLDHFFVENVGVKSMK
jgi:transcriptional regulator with XRE-family HTH domain